MWATDLWISASENRQRIHDAGIESQVFPLHADARSLPFAGDFFDAIVCVDAFYYFGTDDLYLNYLAHFVRPGGPIGVAGVGLQDRPHRWRKAGLTGKDQLGRSRLGGIAGAGGRAVREALPHKLAAFFDPERPASKRH